MKVVDIKWTVEQWKQSGKRLRGLLSGRDGYVYQAYSRRPYGRTGRLPTFVVSAYIQRWYACDACRDRFLGERMLFDELYKTESMSKWKQAQEVVKTDPDAVVGHKIFRL